ncbi:vacuolar membrane protein [Thelephora terrestris]|uniref:Vacuolar membrane protein n=1 Tax=Thelephora terrestris TaxID=56493 RepID=A0A9P6L4D4_9AGAM|nr:vacuolar membrane protein [Thelephora terrestris]
MRIRVAGREAFTNLTTKRQMPSLPPPSSPGDGVPDDFPDIDKHSCRLLGPTALVVQGLLGLLVILSLVYKRHRESPKRPWKIWLFDVAKQLAGQMFVHGVNLLISGVVAQRKSGNACVLYFLNILIDTTLGVGIIYYCLKYSTLLLSEKLGLEGFRSGEYGSPPSPTHWMRQLLVYVSCLTVMKLTVLGLFAIWPGIFKIGDWLLSWLGNGDAAQVTFVMGLFPIIMNVVQFWLIDSIVKAHTPPLTLDDVDEPSRHGPGDGDREPLFQAGGSDDEEEALDEPGSTPSKHDVENPEPLTVKTATVTTHPRPLTPDSRAFPSGSSTPFHGEVNPDDVVMRRVHSPSPPPAQRPAATKPNVLTQGDEWAWDEAGEVWDSKRSLDASRPHHD